MKKVLAICLDGYDQSLGIELMRQGKMPALQALLADSARFNLDHGAELRTGLAGEHVATGLGPDKSGRSAAVHFDRNKYDVWQEGTSLLPFPSGLPFETVVFDTTYFDLEKADDVRGLVNWGAHDPGSAAGSNPSGLMDEIAERFGDYPAGKWIYGLPWNSVEDSQEMGTRLTEAVDLRADIAEWLFTERMPDWDLAMLTVSEAHSVIEGLWHGVDPGHPLHIAPSATVAGEGVRNVYQAIDRLIARLRSRLPGVVIVVFSMHGMGPNGGDAANFLLLAELLYRDQFNKPFFDREGVHSPGLNNQVDLPEGQNWLEWIAGGFPPEIAVKQSILRTLEALKRFRFPDRIPINWIPATRYRAFWPKMRAFCLPAYYDGRVRINLQGRERNGIVPLEDYGAERERIVAMVSECCDAVSGQGVVADVDYSMHPSPLELSETESDFMIIWKGGPTGIQHPRLGQIGPVPYRRTGGHAGGFGFACVLDGDLAVADHGLRSSFDVVPTLLDLLHYKDRENLSGASLLE